MTPEERKIFQAIMTEAIVEVTSSPPVPDEDVFDTMTSGRAFSSFVRAFTRANIKVAGYDPEKAYEPDDVFVITFSRLGAIILSALHAGTRIGASMTRKGVNLP